MLPLRRGLDRIIEILRGDCDRLHGRRALPSRVCRLLAARLLQSGRIRLACAVLRGMRVTASRALLRALCAGAGAFPALGGGSGTFRYRFNDYLSENGLSIPKEQDGVALPDYFDTPHNEYIAQLTDHGFPAMLLFLVLLLLAVFRRQEKGFPILSPCSAAVLCYAVQAFFSFSVCIVAPMFWVVLALSFGE